MQGGEYSTVDILKQRRRVAELSSRRDSLQRIVDSLRKQEVFVRTDPPTQERIAREEFGMVRGTGEMLYRFVPDSVDVKPVR